MSRDFLIGIIELEVSTTMKILKIKNQKPNNVWAMKMKPIQMHFNVKEKCKLKNKLIVNDNSQICSGEYVNIAID